MKSQTQVILRHFPGRPSTGLRRVLRETVSAPLCADEARRRVLAVRHRLALAVPLESVADELAALEPDSHPRCDCESCYLLSLQGMGALG